jgi:ATP adenylyltransferase
MRHVSDLTELTLKEQRSFFELAAQSEAALIKALNPQGINMGMNIGKAAGAGIESHIHMHIVPRWEGDTNFMPITADCRIMPDHLNNTYKKLLPFFKDL